jgi:hypothetical protein
MRNDWNCLLNYTTYSPRSLSFWRHLPLLFSGSKMEAASSSQIWEPPTRLHSHPHHNLNNLFFTYRIHLAIICNNTRHYNMYKCCGFSHFRSIPSHNLDTADGWGRDLTSCISGSGDGWNETYSCPCALHAGKWAGVCVRTPPIIFNLTWEFIFSFVIYKPLYQPPPKGKGTFCYILNMMLATPELVFMLWGR